VKDDAEQVQQWLRQNPRQEQEWLRQLSLIYGALIVIGVYMVQPFLTAPSLDLSAKVSALSRSRWRSHSWQPWSSSIVRKPSGVEGRSRAW
jgi:hypothetical protein